MDRMSTSITGAEEHGAENSPLGALVGFYRAFNGRDLGGLAENWLDGDEPSMDNPIGGIRRGWTEIRAGYHRLFSGPARVSVAFFDYTQQQGEDWALYVGREKGACKVDDASLELAIRTTRWFVKKDGLWRQLHHHGSIESGAMLSQYQRMIFGAAL